VDIQLLLAKIYIKVSLKLVRPNDKFQDIRRSIWPNTNT
jgi:hypothetical protein